MQKELPNAIEISTKVLDDAVAFTSNYFQYVKKNKPHVYLQLSAQELFDINAEYLPDSFFGSPEMQALNDAVDGLNIDEISPILNAILQECGFYSTDDKYCVPVDCDVCTSLGYIAPERNYSWKEIVLCGTALIMAGVTSCAVVAIKRKSKKG